MREQIFRTRITDLLGIRHPILCGGLGPRVSDGRYVAAIVNAGGMGFIAAAGYDDREDFIDELRTCRTLTDGKPFGVNLYISRRPGAEESLLALIPTLVDHGVTAVETAGGHPGPLLPALREAGLTVLHKAPGVRYAQTAARLGVDGVILVGAECGGHPGTVMTGSIVQAAHAPEVLGIPIVIAGGIGHGAQLASVLAMGCDGVLLGTRMLVAEELWIHHDHKKRIIAADGSESVIIKKVFRDNHRVLDNETARAVLALERQGSTAYEDYALLISGSLTRRGYETGDASRGTYDWGQSAVFADEVKPVEAIFDQFLDQAASAVGRLSRLSPTA